MGTRRPAAVDTQKGAGTSRNGALANGSVATSTTGPAGEERRPAPARRGDAIPAHRADGSLPAGVHRSSWAEFERRFAWNPVRAGMLERFARALRHLSDGGIERVVVAGSFVTTKADPSDIDGVAHLADASVHDARVAARQLEVLRRGFGMHLFPAEATTFTDRGPLTMAQFARRNRAGRPVGVVQLSVEDVVRGLARLRAAR